MIILQDLGRLDGSNLIPGGLYSLDLKNKIKEYKIYFYFGVFVILFK